MNPRNRHAPRVAGKQNSLVGRIFSGRAVNGAVHAALPRAAQNLLNRLSWFQHHIGADPPRQLAPVRQRFHGPDASHARRPQ